MLEFTPFLDHPEYLPEKSQALVKEHDLADKIFVAKIDPEFADGQKLADQYGVDIATELNCLVFAGKRQGQVKKAAVLVPYEKRVNSGSVLKHAMDVSKVSFANLDEVTEETGMEFGSITAVGLPADYQILVDSSVQNLSEVVIGSGKVDSKIKTTPAVLASLPNCRFIENLAK